jgi:hypothetical protein
MDGCTPDDILKLFAEIESACEVEKLIFKNVALWPLFRRELGYGLLNNQHSRGNFPKKIKLLSRFGLVISLLVSPFKLIKLWKYRRILVREQTRFLKSVGQTAVFAYPEDLYVDSIRGKKYSRYLDPYAEVLSKTEACFIFGVSPVFREKDTYVHPVDYYDFRTYRKYMGLKQDFFQIGQQKDERKIQAQFAPIQHFLSLKNIKFQLNHFNVSKVYEAIEAESFFLSLFEKSQLKVIFTECFHEPVKLGMISACRKLGIKTVDIQHGAITDFMYLPWKSSMGKDLPLPDFIWCWSKSDCTVIEKYNQTFPLLRPVLGGNMWMKKFMAEEIPPAAQLSRLKEIVSGFAHAILVSHQFGYGLSKELSLAMKNITGSRLWLWRFHPLTSPAERVELETQLKEHQNVHVIDAGEIHLYSLFKLADRHVTYSSATAMEALSFGLKTILIHPNGKDYFKDPVSDGVMHYAQNHVEILYFIDSEINPEATEEVMERYRISCDEHTAESAIRQIRN